MKHSLAKLALGAALLSAACRDKAANERAKADSDLARDLALASAQTQQPAAFTDTAMSPEPTVAAPKPKPQVPAPVKRRTEPKPEPKPRVVAQAPAPAPEPPPAPAAAEPPYEQPEERIEPPESFAAEPLPPPAEPAAAEPREAEVSQFDYEPPFRRRRNLLRLWTIAAGVFAVFALGIVFAVSYWGLPDWVPVSRPTFGLGQQDLVLDFPQNKQDRRQLPNGTEFFGASGSVTNVGSRTRSLPPILIVLRDARDRIVYTWEIAPPQRTIAPGETVTVNEAVTDIPKAAKYAEFGWKPG